MTNKLKSEMRTLARPKQHYLFCLSRYNQKSRKRGCFCFALWYLFSYELLYFANVVMDAVFVGLWTWIYLRYAYLMINCPAEQPITHELKQKYFGFVYSWFGFFYIEEQSDDYQIVFK